MRVISGFARRARGKMRVISGFARVQRPNFTAFRALLVCSGQISLHFGLCMCAATKFHCISGTDRVQRPNFTAFRALIVCSDQISLHFGRCSCAAAKFHCISGACTACKGQKKRGAASLYKEGTPRKGDFGWRALPPWGDARVRPPCRIRPQPYACSCCNANGRSPRRL